MPSRDLVVNVDVNSAQAMAATSAYEKSLVRLDGQLGLAAKSQAKYDAAVAASGASSKEAAAAQASYEKRLLSVTAAQNKAAIAAQRSSEIQAASAQKAAAAQEAAAAKQAAALKKVGTGFGLVGAAAALGLTVAARAASDFNSKMALVASLSHASAAQVQQLADAAHGYANIGISATEAADAEIELTKAGIGVQQQLGGALTGTLNLAAAGQASVADATQIAAVAMTQFKLSAEDVPHLADLLAAGADKALGSVTDLGYGLSQAGLPAHQLGVSVEETVGALAEFAQAGLIGERGGTVLKQMFLKLEAPSAKAKGLMDQYNISLYNAQGNFVGLANLAGQLQAGLGDLSQQERDTALATIFGSRAIQGANILYKDGAAGVADWTKKVNDSGFAAQQAAGKMDSLKGDAQKLGAVLQNDLIDAGQRLQPLLREITQDLTVAGRAFGDIPGPVKDVAVNLAAITAAVGLGVFAFTRLKLAGASLAKTLGIVTIAETATGDAAVAMSLKSQLAANKMMLFRGGALAALAGLVTLQQHLGPEHDVAKGFTDIAIGAAAGTAILPGWGTAIGAAAGTAYALSQNLPGTTVAIQGFTESLDKSTGAATKATRAWAFNQAIDMAGILDKAGVSAGTFVRALMGAPDAIDSVNAAARDLGGPVGDILLAMLDKTGSEAADAQQRIRDLAAAVGSLHNPEVSAADAARHLGGAVQDFGVQVDTAGHKAAGARGGVDGLGHSMDDLAKAAHQAWAETLRLNNLALTRSGDWSSYQQAIDDASQALKDNGKGLDQTTQKGRDNKAVLDSIASSAAAYAQTISNPLLRLRFLEDSRQQLIKTAMDFGDTKAEAKAYADSVASIPKEAYTQAILDNAQAQLDLKNLVDKYNLTPKEVKTIVTAAGAQSAAEQVQALLNYENALHDKAIGINVGINYYQTGTSNISGGHVVGGGADGGLVASLPRRASGGLVYGGDVSGGGYIAKGPGTPTSDSMLFRGSKREFVEPARSVDYYGVPFMESIRNLSLPKPQGLWAGGMPGGGPGGGQYGHTVVMQAPAPKGPLMVEGRLTIDEQGRAYLYGVARHAVTDEAAHEATMRRMRQ